jgi:hypothetical protein
MAIGNDFAALRGGRQPGDLRVAKFRIAGGGYLKGRLS